MKIFPRAVAGALILLLLSFQADAGKKQIAGVSFPDEKVVAGRKLFLNGVTLRRAYFFVKVFAGGFYLEHPTHDAEKAITSDQVKHFHLHYLTSLATAKKLQKGFIEAMEKANPAPLVARYSDLIRKFAAWLDQDMQPGDISESTYVPEQGLTLWAKGQKKGTIRDMEFIGMYYRYSLRKKADSRLRKGYLGLE